MDSTFLHEHNETKQLLSSEVILITELFCTQVFFTFPINSIMNYFEK